MDEDIFCNYVKTSPAQKFNKVEINYTYGPVNQLYTCN